jgi:hypothetical protein
MLVRTNSQILCKLLTESDHEHFGSTPILSPNSQQDSVILLSSAFDYSVTARQILHCNMQGCAHAPWNIPGTRKRCSAAKATLLVDLGGQEQRHISQTDSISPCRTTQSRGRSMTSVEKGGKVGSAAPNSICLTFIYPHERS